MVRSRAWVSMPRGPTESSGSGNCPGTVRALVVVWDHHLDDGGVVAAPAAL